MMRTSTRTSIGPVAILSLLPLVMSFLAVNGERHYLWRMN